MFKILLISILVFINSICYGETTDCTIGGLLKKLTTTRDNVDPYLINNYKQYTYVMKIGDRGFFDIDALMVKLKDSPIRLENLKALKAIGVKRVEVTLHSQKKTNGVLMSSYDSPKVGLFEIKASELWDEMYTVKDFSNLSDLKKGEYIHFNSTNATSGKEFQVTDINGKNILNDDGTLNKLEFATTSDIVRIKFEKVLSEEELLTKVSYPTGQNENIITWSDSIYIKVKRSDMDRSFPRNSSIVEKQLELLDDISLKFIIGEKVRFRDSTGVLKSGVIENASSPGEFIISYQGKHLRVETESVFKSIKESFSTPQYKSHHFVFLSKPEGLYRSILNGASKLTSTSEFKSLKEIDQVLTLTRYIKKFMQPTNIANSLEFKGFDSLSKILCTGTGVCRHNATVLGTTLKESGFNPKLRIFLVPGTNRGHAWLEITIDNKVYVLDGNLGGEDFILKKMDEAIEFAKEDLKSADAVFYTQPGRLEILPTPQN